MNLLSVSALDANVHVPVSVLMTVYNGEEFLQEAIDSVLCQSLRNFELIIVENGSNDNSRAIIKSYPDDRIRAVFLKENIGRPAALSLALNLALAEYVAILDSDDVAMSERLLTQKLFLDANKRVVLVASWAEIVDSKGKQIASRKTPLNSDAIEEICCYENPFIHSSVMYRRVQAIKAGSYCGRYNFSHDYLLYLKLSELGNLAIIEQVLCKWRLSPRSITNDRARTQANLQEILQLLKTYCSRRLQTKKARTLNFNKIARYEAILGFNQMVNRSYLSGAFSILRSCFWTLRWIYSVAY